MAKLIVLVMLSVLSATGALASDPSQAPPDVTGHEGSYVRTGERCQHLSRATLTHDTDSQTGELSYHLHLLRDDNRVWSSREFRSINGAPWYKSNVSEGRTISGRSRYACGGTECILWNERQTCVGIACTRWSYVRSDRIVFDDGVMKTFSPTDGECTYRLR